MLAQGDLIRLEKGTIVNADWKDVPHEIDKPSYYVVTQGDGFSVAATEIHPFSLKLKEKKITFKEFGDDISVNTKVLRKLQPITIYQELAIKEEDESIL